MMKTINNIFKLPYSIKRQLIHCFYAEHDELFLIINYNRCSQDAVSEAKNYLALNNVIDYFIFNFGYYFFRQQLRIEADYFSDMKESLLVRKDILNAEHVRFLLYGQGRHLMSKGQRNMLWCKYRKSIKRYDFEMIFLEGFLHGDDLKFFNTYTNKKNYYARKHRMCCFLLEKTYREYYDE